jgi:hypothetical protein
MLVDKSLLSYARPVIFSGFQASQHDPSQLSTFETFDLVKPDIYLADADMLNKTVYKNIEERPALKVCVIQRSSSSDVVHPNHAAFTARFGSIYEWIIDSGHADLFSYKDSKNIDAYKADIVSIESNPIAGIENLQIPDSFIFRIFSERIVKSDKFCGFVSESNRKNIYKSSKFSISQGDNVYNSLICDCYPLSINSDILSEINKDKSKELKELKEKTLNSITNFHAVASVLEFLNAEKESKVILKKLKEML